MEVGALYQGRPLGLGGHVAVYFVYANCHDLLRRAVWYGPGAKHGSSAFRIDGTRRAVGYLPMPTGDAAGLYRAGRADVGPDSRAFFWFCRRPRRLPALDPPAGSRIFSFGGYLESTRHQGCSPEDLLGRGTFLVTGTSVRGDGTGGRRGTFPPSTYHDASCCATNRQRRPRSPVQPLGSVDTFRFFTQAPHTPGHGHVSLPQPGDGGPTNTSTAALFPTPIGTPGSGKRPRNLSSNEKCSPRNPRMPWDFAAALTRKAGRAALSTGTALPAGPSLSWRPASDFGHVSCRIRAGVGGCIGKRGNPGVGMARGCKGPRGELYGRIGGRRSLPMRAKVAFRVRPRSPVALGRRTSISRTPWVASRLFSYTALL